MKKLNAIRFPAEEYHSDCSKGLVSRDSGQLDVINRLDSVCGELECEKKREIGCFWSFLGVARRNRWQSVRGVYLWGAVGRGKTYLMDLFYNSLKHSPKKRMHFHVFMQTIHHDLKEKASLVDPLVSVAESWARQARVLCLDEFQVSDITDAMLLDRLLKNLFELGVTLIATSNEHPDSLYSGGLQRERFLPAIDRIKYHTTVVEIKGNTDYRLRTLESAPVYYVGEKDEFGESFAELFSMMVGGGSVSCDDIVIVGRPIKVEKAADGIVWARFDELCVDSRSTIDYIEMGKLYHTILLENVPLLRDEDDDAARRFINFIDEIYDRSVNLIISAVADPELLYSGVRLARSFQRTISRLIEMRSKEYLSRPHKAG